MPDIASNQRPITTPPELEQSEQDWWRKYAELEDRFAWVQTPEMQQILRGHYLREIIRAAPPGGRILELGCGTGWLCQALARCGATEVWGIDFSPAQISLARQQAAAAGLSDRVHFKCMDGTTRDTALETFDCVIVHGFLHHLDQTEIRRCLENIPSLLKPNGAFIVFEPILQNQDPNARRSGWEKCQRKLTYWASRGQRYGVRRVVAEERRWRDLFTQHFVGVPPHGPSPKEMPFRAGELEHYLERHFSIERRQYCMVLAHQVVQEWLLRQISHPRSSRWLLPKIARLAAWIDQKMIRQAILPSGLWIFTMFLCRARPPATK